MNKIILFTIIFISGEFLAAFIFLWLNHFFVKEADNIRNYTITGLFKGILERFLLFFAFSYNIFMILAFFGAIKIGTRLEADKTNKVSNDYFLIGNFISVLFALIYYIVYETLRS